MGRWSLEDVLNNTDELTLEEIDTLYDELNGNEVVIYHGSNMSVPSPDADYQDAKETTDFGRGFYATTSYEQACSWAYRKAARKGDNPTVSVYVYNCSYVEEYSFGTDYTEEWLDYIVQCRQNGRTYKLGDVIYGCVADDDVITTIEDYMKGYMGKEEALKALQFKDFSDQYCFATQSVINNNIVYKGCIYV